MADAAAGIGLASCRLQGRVLDARKDRGDVVAEKLGEAAERIRHRSRSTVRASACAGLHESRVATRGISRA